ncbi:hypothetical protein DPEC_G00072900 [Dallia pectoralis]|uniref:Uncharacterized protein n=1 Tax=Dallia pectoralis TaxID=75939 RepID=A0ACC2H3H7_DALPE|nr:hypothetical protein DPEC_G00072900 [Dallia pectoralis]
MAASTRAQALSLYRLLMKESSKLPSYNFRTYALRRVRDAFRANQLIEDPNAVEKLLKLGKDNLDLIRRQVTIGQMYTTQKTVVEV